MADQMPAMPETPETPEIDLSAGLQPKPISATGQTTPVTPEIDLSAGLQPKPVQPTPPAPEQPASFIDEIKAAPKVWEQELFGPNTYLGNLGRASVDAYHNIQKGEYSKAIWGDTAPHVTAGSDLEKVIQKFNPDFKGQGTPESAAAFRHAITQPLQTPIINVGDQIDKDKHPMMKAVAEAASSFTNPTNIAILAGSGGLGMVSSAAKLGVASKLLGAGFSAIAVGDMYKRFPDFKKAWDAGDTPEALYQATHLVLSGAMSAAPLAEAAVLPRDVNAAKTAAEIPGQAAEAVSGAAGKAADVAGKVITGAKNIPERLGEIGAPKPTQEGLVGKITQASDTGDLAAAGRALPKIDTTKVKTFQDLRNTLDSEVRSNTAQVDELLGKRPELYKAGDLEKTTPVEGGRPIVTNPVQDALDQLNDYYQKTKDVKGEAKAQALQTKLEETGLTAKEINDVARLHGKDLNAYNANGELASGLTKIAAENTRTDVKEQVRQIAPEIQDVDSHTSDLIKTRGLAEDMATKVQSLQNKLQAAGYWRRSAAAASKFTDTITGGFLKSLVKSGQEGAGALNAVEIQDKLSRNLDKLNAMSAKDAAKQIKLDLPALEGVQERPIDIPSNRVRRGEGTLQEKSSRGRDNEWGHVIAAHKVGFLPKEIISHNHENIAHTRIAAETHIDAPIPEGKSGLSTEQAMNDHLHNVLTTVMAGPAANEIHSGLSLEENPMAHGDLQFARKVVKEAGFSPEEGEATIKAAYERAKELLSDEHARDILREYSDTREPGLDERFHASNDRIKEATSELDRRQGRQNEGNNGRLEAGNAEHDTGNVAGSEGQTAGEPKEESVATGKAEVGGKEVKVPPERSTGNTDIDAAIKEGGAIPGGMQKGDPEIGVPDLVLFHDPKTGSTLAYLANKVTPETIASELAKSRKAFSVPAEENPQRYQVYDPKTGNVLGEYSTSKRARSVVDKKDLEYGAARYAIRPAPQNKP